MRYQWQRPNHTQKYWSRAFQLTCRSDSRQQGWRGCECPSRWFPSSHTYFVTRKSHLYVVLAFPGKIISTSSDKALHTHLTALYQYKRATPVVPGVPIKWYSRTLYASDDRHRQTWQVGGRLGAGIFRAKALPIRGLSVGSHRQGPLRNSKELMVFFYFQRRRERGIIGDA